MLRPRMMPCLLLKNMGLVKTIQFKNSRYIGDPINAVHIFNEEWVDELIFLDIEAHRNGHHISSDLVSKISDECYMPLTVGGGISTIESIHELLRAGAEKVAINTCALENPDIIREASRIFGSQSIVVSIDARLLKNGEYEAYTHGGTKPAGITPVVLAKRMEESGAGEIMINSIDRDGTWSGYDLNLVRMITSEVKIPVIACGGAGSVDDLAKAVYIGHASAVAAGSMFIYHGKKHAVLINFPSRDEIEKSFGDLVKQNTIKH
jgi:imidazole glycerol-phosphate synthase subunit HisF